MATTTRLSKSLSGRLRNFRRMTLAVTTVIALFGSALLGTIGAAGWSANRFAASNEHNLVENALNQSIAKVLSDQKSVAWWDEAVRQIDADPRSEWVKTEFGVYLTETYGHSEIYIVDAQDHIAYGFANGAPIAEDVVGRRTGALRPLIRELREGTHVFPRQRPDLFVPSQESYEGLAGVRDRVAWRGHILKIDDQPMIVTGITIVPNLDPSLLKGKPAILLSLVRINEKLITDVGNLILLSDLKLSADRPVGTAPESEALIGDDDSNLGFLSWTPQRPGQILLAVILPFVLAGVLGTGLLCAIMLRRIRITSTELAEREVAAQHQARHDALSGLPNRHAFVEEIDNLLADPSGAGPRRAVVCYLDIDRFKDVNDTLGHPAGDELIKAVAVRLREQLDPADVLARFGGDEFAVLRRDGGEAEADDLARVLQAALVAPFLIAGQTIHVTASAGFAVAPEQGRTSEELIRNADIALYEAKRNGRDRVMFFSARMAAEVQERHDIEADLRHALATQQLRLAYQPIIACASRTITGVEALLRWRHPVKGDIPPGAFIPIAEEVGLMPAIGDWVLKKAIADAERWPSLQVSLNLSSTQFRHSALKDLLKRLVLRHAVRPDNIVLEVTESVLLDQTDDVIELIEAIRRQGFKIALDDFGTGYSSLSYLARFQFDKLKIDRGFVASATTDPTTRVVVGSIAAMGRGLGMDVVAEGVETAEQAEIMRLFGTTHLQGFHFSAAIEVEAVEGFVAEFNALAAPGLAEDGKRERKRA